MLKKHLHQQIIENLDFSPTSGQESLAGKLGEFIGTESNDVIFSLKGYAGTGKTSMVNALVKTLAKFKFQSILLAPTGRAAKVLTSYTGKNAYTIHKKIYRQKTSSDGMGKFVLDRNLHKNTFFIVDEA